VKQWSDEFSKTKGLRIAVISTIVNLRKFSYQDFIDYDVVIVTYQMLQNPSYFFFGSDKPNKKNIAMSEDSKRFNTWVWKVFETVKKSKQDLDEIMCPLFEHFFWYRLVLDEGHEYLDRSIAYNVIQNFKRCYSWYVSGTPFPQA
jgi:SNF2 family DNA or RNA helicase